MNKLWTLEIPRIFPAKNTISGVLLQFSGGCAWGARGPEPYQARGERATIKKFEKNTTTLVRLCRSPWYIYMPSLSNV